MLLYDFSPPKPFWDTTYLFFLPLLKVGRWLKVRHIAGRLSLRKLQVLRVRTLCISAPPFPFPPSKRTQSLFVIIQNKTGQSIKLKSMNPPLILSLHFWMLATEPLVFLTCSKISLCDFELESIKLFNLSQITSASGVFGIIRICFPPDPTFQTARPGGIDYLFGCIILKSEVLTGVRTPKTYEKLNNRRPVIVISLASRGVF